MKRISPLWLVLFIAVLTLAACGGADTSVPVPVKASTPGLAQQSPRAQEPATPPTPEPRPTAQPTVSPTQESLPVPKTGALRSYIAEFEIKEEIVKPSPGIEEWFVAEIRHTSEPPPGALALSFIDKQDPKAGETKLVMVDEETYLFDPEQGNRWFRMPGGLGSTNFIKDAIIDPETLAAQTPTDIFTQANVVNQHEPVDGVDTTHYRVKAERLRDLILGTVGEGNNVISGDADFWIADMGNYVKQWTWKAVIVEESGREISQAYRLLVTGENEPVAIETPAPGQVSPLLSFGTSAVPPASATPSSAK